MNLSIPSATSRCMLSPIMKLVFKAATLGAITEALVWLDLLIHPVGQGPMATPSPMFLFPHVPAIALLETWYFSCPDWLRMTLFLTISWATWSLVWVAVMLAWKKLFKSQMIEPTL